MGSLLEHPRKLSLHFLVILALLPKERRRYLDTPLSA